MTDPRTPNPGLRLEVPGSPTLLPTDLLIDFSGTLALDGAVLPGVPETLTQLSAILRITVASADTFGSAREALAGLPVTVSLVEHGEHKAEIVRALGADHVVAVGNGRNDVPMFRAAAFSIAVLGPEGTAAELLAAADLVAPSILAALDLLRHPIRLKASLRP